MNLINLDRTQGELTNLTLKTIRLRGSQSLQKFIILNLYQLDMLNICSSVQDHNLSTIHKNSD